MYKKTAKRDKKGKIIHQVSTHYKLQSVPDRGKAGGLAYVWILRSSERKNRVDLGAAKPKYRLVLTWWWTTAGSPVEGAAKY